MDKDRSDAALRCLEMALHPNTGDDEAVAGIYAFRRLAAGRSVGDLLRQFARTGREDPARQINRLAEENRRLRHQLESSESGRSAATRLSAQTLRQLSALREELRQALERAEAAERRECEARAAYSEAIRVLQAELAELRRIEGTRREPIPVPTALPQFRALLTAAAQAYSGGFEDGAAVQPEAHRLPARANPPPVGLSRGWQA
jgi:hypothetical protein